MVHVRTARVAAQGQAQRRVREARERTLRREERARGERALAAAEARLEDWTTRWTEAIDGRATFAGDVAATTLFLASDLAAGITGQLISVDAGVA